MSGEVVVESDSTKADASQRRIALDSETVRIVRGHRRRQAEERLALGPLWIGDATWVFTRPDDGLPIRPSDVAHAFTKVVRRLGLPEVDVHG